MQRLSLLLSLGLLLGASMASAQPSPEDKEKARALYASAQASAKTGACTKAIPEYQEAYKLSGSVEILLPLGLCYDKLERFAEELSAYCEYEKLSSKTSPYLEDTRKRRIDLEKKLGRTCLENEAFLAAKTVTPESQPASTPATTPAQPVSAPASTQSATSEPSTQEAAPRSFNLGSRGEGPSFAWTTRTAVAGSALGLWALRIARKRNNDEAISSLQHTKGVLVAATADLSFVAAGVTFTISMIKRQKYKKQKKEASSQPASEATSLPDSAPASSPTSAPVEGEGL